MTHDDEFPVAIRDRDGVPIFMHMARRSTIGAEIARDPQTAARTEALAPGYLDRDPGEVVVVATSRVQPIVRL